MTLSFKEKEYEETGLARDEPILKQHPNPRTITVEPNWQQMFRCAIELTTSGVSEGQGQAVIIEMLEYGQRLDAEFTKFEEGLDN